MTTIEAIYNTLFGSKNSLFAHSKDGDFEDLLAHSVTTLNVSKTLNININKQISILLHINIEVVDYLVDHAILMHDFGKGTPFFQYYRLNTGIKPQSNFQKELTHHAQLSALYYLQEMSTYLEEIEVQTDEVLLFVLLLTQVIAKHHSRLNNLSDFINELDQFILEHSMERMIIQEWLSFFQKENIFLSEKRTLSSQFYELIERIPNEIREKLLSINLILFSVLTISDLIATKQYAQNYRIKRDEYNDALRDYLTLSYNLSPLAGYVREYQLSSPKTLNKIRSEFILNLDKHLHNAPDTQRLFHLEGLVGIGKTHASQRFIIDMIRRGAKRVFWGVPFTAIATQLYTNNTILDPQAVQLDTTTFIREEFSNFNLDYTKMVMNHRLMNYRNASITFVRFFNLLFGNSKSDALQRLAIKDSIIVLDEIQSIDVNLMNMFVQQIEWFAELLNFKVLFMSATLQQFSRTYSLSDPEIFRQETILTHRNELDFTYYDTKQDHVAVLDHIEIKNKRILVQCVTKKKANDVYEKLKSNNEFVYLYTSETPLEERNNIVRMLKEKKNSQYMYQEFILVTTNAIEAGVDISMNLAVVDLTTVDSLEQLSGRINRNREFSPEESKIYLINFEEARFLSPIKVSQTNKLTPLELNSLFTSKHYTPFMTSAVSYAAKNKEYYLQKKALTQLEFKTVDQLMKLIVENSIQYYHIKDKESCHLFKEYLGHREKMRINKSNYDEEYIHMHTLLKRLASYRVTIQNREIQTRFLNEVETNPSIYNEGLLYFYLQDMPYGENGNKPHHTL